MTVMVMLMGEQPAANLLPVRAVRPDTVLLVVTTRTEAYARRFAKVITSTTVAPPLVVGPYHAPDIAAALQKRIQEEGWQSGDLLFNLTGGTKMMSLAAYEVARTLSARFDYLQTEGNRSLLYHHSFAADGSVRLDSTEELPEGITLADHLSLYLDVYKVRRRPKEPLERLVYNALVEGGLEVLPSVRPPGDGHVEIDLALRLGNQIGVMEVKSKELSTKGWEREALNQVVSVAGQRYIGTFVKRFLVSNREFTDNTVKHARSLNVHLISLPSFVPNGVPILSSEDQQQLVSKVRVAMGDTNAAQQPEKHATR